MLDKFSKVLQSASKNLFQFRRAVAKLRSEISVQNYPKLQNKIKKNYPKYAAHTLLPSKRKDWEDLRHNSSLIYPLTLKYEVSWQITQLAEHVNQLNKHVSLIANLSHAINFGDFDNASELLDQHYTEHGATLWNLEARIALASRTIDGSSTADELINQLKPGLEGSLAFLVCYIFSDLYDQATTSSGFTGRVERMLSADADNIINTYLKVKFFRDTFTSSDLATFLVFESSYSYVDAYEAILKVITESTIPNDGEIAFNDLVITTKALAEIRDIRLNSLYRLITVDENCFQNIFDDDKFLLLNRNHYPSLEKIGNYLSTQADQDKINLSHVESIIADLLIQFCDERIDLHDLYRNLDTTISKHHYLPWYRAIASTLHGLFFPLSADKSYLRYLAACTYSSISNTDNMNKEDNIPIPKLLHEYGIYTLPWLRLYSSNPALRVKFLSALWKINNNDAVGTIQELDYAQFVGNKFTYGTSLLKISALLQVGDEKSALELCVKLAVLRESIAGFLPFDTIVSGGKEWSDINTFDYVDLAIGLHFSALSGDTKDKFNLEFTCKKLLLANQCKTLADYINNFDKTDKRLPFLLWKVFIPSNLRLVNFLRNIEEADNARLDVCRVVLDLKKDDVESILDEIRNIIRRKELRQAEKNVESTRIHVNRIGIKRWAEEKYREQFQRIRKSRLVSIAPTVDEIEANLSQLIAEKGKVITDDSITKNMSDPLFAMGVDILTNCFTKGDDGLEHYLSLRIRHGSLTGYLRAPLERAELVEQGELTTQSKLAQHWNNLLSSSDHNSVNKLILGLSEFQKQFDLMFEHLRSNYIQVKSKKNPNGLFVAGLPKLVWDAFHNDWERSETFDKFFDSVWEAFLIALEDGLIAVKQRINVDVLNHSEVMFLELRSLIDAIELSSSDRAALITAINQGATGIQDAIRIVTQWFAFKDDSIENTNINFDQLVELALNVFKNARPALNINIHNNSDPLEVRFSGPIVPQFIDAFFILLDNVYKHSGLLNTATVELWAKWESVIEGKGNLVLELENSLANGVSKEQVVSKFVTVREKLTRGGNEDLLNSEGGSGLFKLARIAMLQNNKNKNPLTFELTKEGKVTVRVNISLSYRETTLFGE